MNDIAEFKARQTEENTPHATGPAKCLACGHEWIFVIPAEPPALGDMECPSCRCNRGARQGLSIPTEPHWICNCGNDLFLVTVDSVFCPHCSTFQTFLDRRPPA